MKKMQEFEKGSLLLFLLMMSANICNYLFQIKVGNMMSIEDYGVVNTLIGVIGILTIPTTIVRMLSARYIALYATVGNQDDVASVLCILLKFVVLIGLVLFITGLAGINSITELFKLESGRYVVGVLLIAVANLFFSITAGILQGLKKFYQYGIQTILTAGGKLVLSIVLIQMGWRVQGVLAAIMCGVVFAMLYGICYMGEYIKRLFKKTRNTVIDIKEFYKYAIGTIVAQGCVIALTNGDILLIKTYFSDTEAGMYSSAMVIGKMAMYVSTAVIAALFPLVVEQKQEGKSTYLLLKKALIYGGGMSLVCAGVMVVLGKYVIGMLFGSRYDEAVAYLPYVCMFVVPLTFITILMNYLLAIGEVKIFDISIGIGLILIVCGSILIHDTIFQVMIICGMVLMIVFVWNVLYLFCIWKSKKST